MDSGLVMMLKSFGIEKLIGQVVTENLPKIEALANDVKARIDEYKAHVDARFDAVQRQIETGFSVADECTDSLSERFDALEQLLSGTTPAGVGQTQKDFEGNLGKLEVRGHLLGVYSDGE